MRKVNFKNVKELYGEGETEVLKPKVSSVVKRSLCSEGFSDEADCVAAALNMGSLISEKGFGNAQLSSRKLSLKEESGTCYMCASSFSPCVHSKQMGTKSNELSGKACQKKVGNCCSFNDADLSSPRVNSACNDRLHTSSETSHPLSVCLSRESFSEVSESKETLRDSKTYERIKMITEQNLRPTCANNIGPLKAPIFRDKIVSNMLEKHESECLGDNISFICVSDYAKTMGSDHNSDADKKNASYNSTSVDSFLGTGKEVNGKPASCFLVGNPCLDVDDNHPRRSNRSSIEFSQEINKSDFSEISSLRDSCAVANSAKREHFECSEEQVQSSFARAGILQVGCQIGDEHTSAESMEVDNGINERAQTAELKSTTVAKEIKIEETNIGPRPAACSDASESIEYEVNVCDICGDIGREELLAVCSNCNDGAEHIYCMRVKMDSVPKGDWMCEECVLCKETERKKQEKLDGGNRTFKKPYTLESEANPLEVEESKEHKVSSTPLFTSKRPGSLHAMRNKGSGTDLNSPASSSSSKALMHQYGGHSSSTTSKTVRMPTVLTSKLPKLSPQYQASKGLLSKSKSFSAMSIKEDVQKEGSFRSEGLAKETAASDSVGRVLMMSKSLSLKNMNSYTVNNSNHDIKLPPNNPRVQDLKRLRHPKGQCPTKTKKKLKLSRSDSLAAMADNRIASPGKYSLAYPSSSSWNDLVDVKGYEIPDNSSRRSSPTAEKKRVVNVGHHVEYSAEVVPAIGKKHTETAVHSDERPCQRDSSMFASEVHRSSWIYVVPQLDFIWEGKFEIQRSGGLPFTCDGLQAHLSTYGSTKVLEVVQKLPRKLLLEEAPRLSLWPTQFKKSHATEDNIALYFFAKELDSYERSSKNLLEKMIKYDYSLKGNFGGFELLIFSSNVLPEKSQRWNNFPFLWGVFRGRRVPGKSSESLSALSSNTLLDSMTVTPGKMVEVCETKAFSLEPKTKTPDLQTSCMRQVGTVDSSKREERESKERPEIDLNYSLQEEQEDFADCTEADGSNDYKRLKSCFSGMNIDSNSIKDINDRCSAPLNGRGPSIFGEFKGDGAYDMSIVSPKLDTVCDKYSWKRLQQRFLSNDSGNQPNSGVSDFELALGVERSFSEPRDEICERETNDDTNPSLDLSLALLCHKVGGSGPKCKEVNTTLSLFGVSPGS